MYWHDDACRVCVQETVEGWEAQLRADPPISAAAFVCSKTEKFEIEENEGRFEMKTGIAGRGCYSDVFY